jgi:hypothetical protein
MTRDNAEPLAGASGIRFSSGKGLFVTAFRRGVGLHPSIYHLIIPALVSSHGEKAAES